MALPRVLSRRLIAAPGDFEKRHYRLKLARWRAARIWAQDRLVGRPENVRFGSKADMSNASTHVRFTPNSDRESRHPQKVMSALPLKSGHVRCTNRCPLWAKSGHRLHSITSLARASSDG